MFRFISILMATILLSNFSSPAQTAPQELLVKKCPDFNITGSGDDANWNSTPWTTLKKLDPGNEYETKFKILYSATGIYVLFTGTDKRITTTYENDFEDLFKADVFEVFFHPDTNVPLYLEYEINHLNKELVLLIPNLDGRATGWIPWHYEGAKRTKKMVKITGGSATAGGELQSWSAEIFFPYRLFSPLGNIPPRSGTTWNANFYRLDYDNNTMVKWAWSPVERSFHEFKKFGVIRFE